MPKKAHLKLSKPRLAKRAGKLEATWNPWVMDPKGYFLIRVNRRSNKIEAGYCKRGNVIKRLITGKLPQPIYYTIIRERLVSRPDHAAYLGKELEKAYLALKHHLEYVQDAPLNIRKKRAGKR